MSRAAIEQLLRAGYGDRTIARRLGVTIGTVRRTRTLLRLPAGRPGPKAHGTPADVFWSRAKPVDGGHMEWTGTVHSGTTPSLRHGGHRYSAYKVAFTLAHGREPVGRTQPGCGHPGCIHPQHLEDQTLRNQYTAIFGTAA
ncbi:hypothetical protein OH540_09600 [Streptomyces sp. BPPL-273]|uniref:hypothetical protein n=1 Tax=Streptomyces sp. BPPL-273 TaxID=2987533 RepID=UPI0024AEE5E3|nr:hypothetical protein [Streptomyces sp. BPPL-273]WHM30277.1 hypothetical protein OH540_09600 [Streptomyces sp. BPPL-273]